MSAAVAFDFKGCRRSDSAWSGAGRFGHGIEGDPMRSQRGVKDFERAVALSRAGTSRYSAGGDLNVFQDKCAVIVAAGPGSHTAQSTAVAGKLDLGVGYGIEPVSEVKFAYWVYFHLHID